MLEPDVEQRQIDITAICREQAASIRPEFPNATVNTPLPAEATALAHPRIGIAIEELLRNAIVHADEPDLTVSITGIVDEETVTIEVADDGPGLPEMELTALEGLFEEPLEHSRGIGLWLVQFLVAKSNGKLDTGGSTVTDDQALADGSGAVVRMTFDREE